jgi:GT2 family glycosyltransferase
MKNCLVVLGMHRSGTSAFTGILDLLGVNLGTKLLETQADNPKGFFENKYVVEANDCILETLETTWDDTFPLPPNWIERFQDSQLLLDIRAFLRSEIKEDQLSALKDPRLCRLLALWLPLFETEGVSPHIALVIRNPLEIAESLETRNQFSSGKSLLLWMQHMMDAERYTRDLPRGFVKFEALLADPQSCVEKLFDSVGLAHPGFSPDSSDELTAFLDRNLRHHKVTETELDARCPKIVANYYRLLCKISEQDQPSSTDIAALNDIYREFEASQALFYNNDLSHSKALDKLRKSPSWYESRLREIRSEFERDRIFREYRYIANTEHLYKANEDYFSRERPVLQSQVQLLQSQVQRLDNELKQFIGSPPWRVYKKYQETIEKYLPQGTVLRRVLQGVKQQFSMVTTAGGAKSHDVTSEETPSANTAVESTDLTIPTSLSGVAALESVSALQTIEFAEADSPLVSIIIPVFNNWQFTYKCLRSLSEHTTGHFEIIVVDNHSSDFTPQLLASIEGIRTITNDSNEVFVNACNQAAATARGQYLLLLNNDTEVTEGWLDAMLDPFSDHKTGIVGAKLVYPDGTLQEAGGIIWRDGTGCNFGHGDDPDLPQYSYRRAVDYCSGACLMLARELWDQLGGFDTRYAPAYYEDTDLCFSARALNLNVIYQPAARVIHYGGASAGKETSSGYKRFQEINRHKFVEKWRQVLEDQHVPSSAGLSRARERIGNKHILVIDHRCPTFDRDSGSLRMLSILQILQDLGYKVAFWPDDLSYDARYTRKLQDLSIETYYGDLEFENFIREQGNLFDAVLISRPATAKKYLQLVKKYSKAQTIFDTVDLHFIREQRRLELEVSQWKNLEFFLAEEADATLVVSPTELDILSSERFADKVAVVSNIHSLEPCVTAFEDRDGLMFIGGFAHPPNEEGIIWFIEYILPVIRRSLPDIHLTIVGSDPSERLKSMASSRITVTGYVEDVSGYFNSNRVFVSPLLHGAGVKGKIGQSFSFGLPVVTTSIGAEGMQLKDGHNALIADSETEFARKVVEVYTDRFLWQQLSANCRQVIRDQFSTETIRASLQKVLERGNRGEKHSLSRPRPVIVHCHLFKNAGSTLDWSLRRYFGSSFIDHRDDDDMRRGAAFLGPFIAGHPEISAISSHHVRFPLPTSEDYQTLPIIALRHPIDRARSVYDFERRQESDTPGAQAAKSLSFTDYIRWRMRPDVAPTLRNFHCSFCTGDFDGRIGEQHYLESVALLTDMPLLIIVERYDESMLLLEHQLGEYFPGINLSYVRQNETPGRTGDLGERVESIIRELGPELGREFQEQNHWDMKLYNDALAIMVERLGALGDKQRLLESFRLRCANLRTADINLA